MRTRALERPEAPLATAPFSSSVTRTWRAASAQAMLAPATPPPTTTTSAVSATAAVQPGQHLVAQEPHRADPGLAGRPLVGDDEQVAEAADVAAEPRELLGDRLGIADEPDVVAQVLDGHLLVRHLLIDLWQAQALRLVQERQEVLPPVAGERPGQRLAPRLRAGLRDVDVPGDPPRRTIGHAAGPVGARLDAVPVGAERARRDEVDAHRDVAPLARQDEGLRALRHPGHADRRVRPLVGAQVEPKRDVLLGLRHPEAPPAGLVEAGLGIAPEIEDQVERLPREGAVVARLRVDAGDVEITGEAPRADPPQEAAARHLVELGDPLGEHER